MAGSCVTFLAQRQRARIESTGTLRRAVMARTFTTTLGAKTLYFGWAGVLAVAGFSGCAFARQSVVISPKVDVPVSRVGADRASGLTIVDERPRQTLGTRGVRGVGAELTVQGDLRTIVETALL